MALFDALGRTVSGNAKPVSTSVCRCLVGSAEDTLLATPTLFMWWRQVIAELDEKKREALEKTWKKVNQVHAALI